MRFPCFVVLMLIALIHHSEEEGRLNSQNVEADGENPPSNAKATPDTTKMPSTENPSDGENPPSNAKGTSDTTKIPSTKNPSVVSNATCDDDDALVTSATETSMTLNLTKIHQTVSKASAYEITVTSAGTDEALIEVVSVQNSTYTITDLHPATNYSITVKMCIQYNQSNCLTRSQSGCTKWNYTSLDKPSCGDGPLVLSSHKNVITLDLSTIDHDEHKADAYEINVNSSTDQKPLKYVDVNSNTFNITDLEPATKYSIDVRICIKDEDSNILSRSQIGCTATEYTRLNDLKCGDDDTWITSETEKSITLDLANIDHNGSKANAYVINVTSPGAMKPFIKVVSIQNSTYTIPDLDPATNYSIDVKMCIQNNLSTILSRSENACTASHYTRLNDLKCGDDDTWITSETEKSITLDLANIDHNGSKANAYVINVTSPGERKPFVKVVNIQNSTYTIPDLDPATIYSIDVKMCIQNNLSTILSRSGNACTASHYTKPSLNCSGITWPKLGPLNDVIVNISKTTAPNARRFIFTVQPPVDSGELSFDDCSTGCRINLTEGSTSTISVKAVQTLVSLPCKSQNFKSRPADPNCTAIIMVSSSDRVSIDMSNVHSNGAVRYSVAMTAPLYKSHDDISPSEPAVFTKLTAGALYTFQMHAVADNNKKSHLPCNISFGTMPNDPICTRNLWASTNDSITLDLKSIATYDTVAHFVTLKDGNSTAFRVPNNDTILKLDTLEPGNLYNFSVTSIGHGNQTSDGNCILQSYTKPNDPLCNQIKIGNISTTSLCITVGTPGSNGATGYRVTSKPGNKSMTFQEKSSHVFNQLTPGTFYEFTLVAIGLENMTSIRNCTAAEYTVPAKPGKITVLNPNETGFKIQWIEADGHVDKYAVNATCNCRQQKDLCNLTVKYDPRTSKSMADISGIVPGTYCTVSVKTISNQKKSDAQEISNIETNEKPSGKVQNLIKDNISSTSVTVRWNPPSVPNGDITSYTVYSFFKDNIITKNQTTKLSFMIQRLSAGICYSVKVTANNSAGEGDPEYVNVYTTERVPEQVVGLSATVDTSRYVNISWQKPNVTNGLIQSYTVQVLFNGHCVHETTMTCSKCISGCPNVVSSAIPRVKGHSSQTKGCNKTDIAFWDPLKTDFQVHVDHLAPFTNYTIQVYASTSAGAGNLSSTTGTTSEEKPSIVTNLKNVSKNSDSITVSFNRPSEPNGIILCYTIEYQYRNHSRDYCVGNSDKLLTVVDYAFVNMTETNSSQTFISHTLNGLYPYWQYSIRVMAGNSAGNSSWSGPLNVTTLSVAPGLVTRVLVSNIEAKSFLISWKQPCFPNGIIDKYNVILLDTRVVINNTSPEIEFNAEDLLPYQNYTYQIKGHTKDGGWGNAYNSTGITTLTDVPNPPKTVEGLTVSSKSLMVNWTAPQHKTGPTWYTAWAIDKVTQQKVASCKTKGFTNTSCLIKNLDEFWDYTLLVVASTKNGSTNASNGQVVRTSEDAPGEIQDLVISVENDTTKPRRVNITWDSPSLRNRNGILKNFYVEYSTPGKVPEIKKIKAPELSLDNLDVVAGEKYTFKVYAETIKNGTIVQKTSGIIPMGAPPLIPQLLIQTGPTGIISNDEKQLSIYLQKEYLCNNANGQPDDWGIIVSQDSETGNTKPYRGSKTGYEAEKKKRYKTWSQVHDNDKMDPYIASNDFNPKCSGKRRKREASNSVINFIVGSDGDCDSSKDICNGYLKPGKTYRVRTWSCTDGGCVESEYSTPLFTEPNRVPLIAGVSSTCIVVIFVGVVGLFIYLRRRQRGPSRKKNGKDSGHSNEGFDRAGEDVEMHKKGKIPRPVRLTDFSNHVGRMHGDSDLLFREEYEIVKNTCARHPATVAEGQGARTKNRYTNILAYDHSRVKLLPTDDEEGSDYINANYIPGYNGQREFIATQGPQASTIDDFWRMIWEQNVTTIVMLTQLVERGRKKCDEYWPGKPFEPVFHGDIVVELTSESTLPNYMLREFALKLGDVTRKVKHFQYLDWPDMGTPETSDSMIGFVRNVRSHVPVTNKGPIVVHCSAGVGRTGTFIAVDHLIHHVKQHDTIDIYDLVMNLRNNRNNMVQTEDQYVFIHDCMNDFINNDDDESDEGQEPVYENA